MKWFSSESEILTRHATTNAGKDDWTETVLDWEHIRHTHWAYIVRQRGGLPGRVRACLYAQMFGCGRLIGGERDNSYHVPTCNGTTAKLAHPGAAGREGGAAAGPGLADPPAEQQQRERWEQRQRWERGQPVQRHWEGGGRGPRHEAGPVTG